MLSMYSFLLFSLLLSFSCNSGTGVTNGSGTGNTTAENTSINPENYKMQYVIHPANTRGTLNAGWLQANYSFSFNNWYDPERMNFGVLRVLNDDIIAPSGGFPTHPHNNMEIITVVLEGAMEHQDNMGFKGIINDGDVQMMSAGTGITHSEYNPSSTDTLKSLQIWMFPNQQNVKPRYQEKRSVFKKQENNSLKTLVSPTDTAALFVYQNAVFTMGKFDPGHKQTYNFNYKGNGVYAFVIDGSAIINGLKVGRRDAVGIWDIDRLDIEATDDLRVLLMEIPML